MSGSMSDKYNGYPIKPDDLIFHKITGKLGMLVSIDGPASASNPLSNYLVTVNYEDGTTEQVMEHRLNLRQE